MSVTLFAYLINSQYNNWIMLNEKEYPHYYKQAWTFDLAMRSNKEYKCPLSFSHTDVVTIIHVTNPFPLLFVH